MGASQWPSAPQPDYWPTQVTLRLGDTVRLTIADNGAGFDPSSVTADHLGLKIMRERAEAFGARFSVYSEPGEGAQIYVIWQ